MSVASPAQHIEVAGPSGDRFMLDDSDVDGDDPSPMSLLTLRAHCLPPASLCGGINGSPHVSLWPVHYIVRPQLLTRL